MDRGKDGGYMKKNKKSIIKFVKKHFTYNSTFETWGRKAWWKFVITDKRLTKKPYITEEEISKRLDYELLGCIKKYEELRQELLKKKRW